MSTPIYKIAGFLSTKSLNYLAALEELNWPSLAIENLKSDLLRFESASIQDSVEEARACFVYEHHSSHLPFFEKLNKHIKAITRAERYEELHKKAVSESKDSIAAHVLMGRAEGKGLDLRALKKKDVRLEKLASMTNEDLQREIDATKRRLGSHV